MLAKSESLLSNYGATKDNGDKLFLVGLFHFPFRKLSLARLRLFRL
jgi:hypothetical protein